MTDRYDYALKVIASCRTEAHIETAKAWIWRADLKINYSIRASYNAKIRLQSAILDQQKYIKRLNEVA